MDHVRASYFFLQVSIMPMQPVPISRDVDERAVPCNLDVPCVASL